MRTVRCYQEPHSPHEIANLLLSKAGSEFNPLLVSNFLNLMSRVKKF
jgi:response regulator RpfG family c-di-GMP phosphodiesterase